MRKFPLALAILLLAFPGFRLFAQQWVDSSTMPASKDVPWRNLLFDFGRKYSIYFTFEYDENEFDLARQATGREAVAPLLSRRLVPPDPKNAQEFLDFLRKSLPEVEITPDELMPEVMHIREKSLDKMKGYLLDQKVTFQFKGTVADLFARITKQFDGRFTEDPNMTSPGARFDTYGISTEIDLKDVPLRTILSKALPHWSSPLLWSCYTSEKNDASVVVFKPSPSSRPAASAPATTKTSTQKN